MTSKDISQLHKGFIGVEKEARNKLELAVGQDFSGVKVEFPYGGKKTVLIDCDKHPHAEELDDIGTILDHLQSTMETHLGVFKDDRKYKAEEFFDSYSHFHDEISDYPGGDYFADFEDFFYGFEEEIDTWWDYLF